MHGEAERRGAHARYALKADVPPPLGAQGRAPRPAMQHNNGIGQDATPAVPTGGGEERTHAACLAVLSGVVASRERTSPGGGFLRSSEIGIGASGGVPGERRCH